jgi:8-oxo-dGTP diphosphatase
MEGVMAIARDEKGNYLLGRESKKGSPIEGMWRFAGGGIKPGETPEECLRREVLKETGIEIQILEHLFDVRGDYVDMMIGIYAARPIGGELKPQKDEFDKVDWVSPGRLEELLLAPLCRKVLDMYDKGDSAVLN